MEQVTAVRLRFSSESDPAVTYRMAVVGGIAVCSCPGFTYRGKCKHADKAEAFLAEQEPERSLTPIRWDAS